MKSMMRRTSIREIKNTFGRFFAILAIIALGVGFFSGVRITTPAMVNTVDAFLQDRQFYDYHLMSTLGWDDENVENIGKQKDVRFAEGAYSMDVLYTNSEMDEVVLKTHSLPQNINGIKLAEGRMPETADECVIDAKLNKEVDIGDSILVAPANDSFTKNALSYSELKIVGKVYSSYYINFERGTTSIGNGSVSGFVYLMPEAFNIDYYTDLFVRFHQDYEIYSEEYKKFMDERLEQWEGIANEQADLRYEKLIDQAKDKMKQAGLEGQQAAQIAEYAGTEQPDTYVLDRNTNIGYACFESDSEIVGQVAKVFPIFFILVAALVCMTTMSRMVEEQRTQIGVLKALGYSETAIMGKYMFYSGSAAVLGCVSGYAIGTVLFPKAIWMSYELMYLPLPMKYLFDSVLALIAIIVSLLCSIGTTWISLRYELSQTAAGLMRPKAPKAGKRVFLEYITLIWNHLKFLHKVSIRNILRYKGRFFMMVVGISGCMALLLTGFGLKDSIAGFARIQYEEIEVADASVTFKADTSEKLENETNLLPSSLTEILEEQTKDYMPRYHKSWDFVINNKVKSISLIAPYDSDNIDNYMKFHTEDGKKLAYPKSDEAIISNSIAERYHVSVGDEINLRDEEMRELHLKVTGIFENHVYNYIFIAPETLEKQLSQKVIYNAAYINFEEDTDIYKASAEISKDENVAAITLLEDLKVRLSNMMSSLNYIVLLVIICAAGLAFIVIYNLTNINITERLREIATIKVLGFFRNETSAYVLRENITLTSIGIIFGLGLGVLLHRFVMQQIVVDMVSFRVKILPMSFVYSILLTFVFNFLVNIVMEFKLEKINMAESLKSVD